MIASMELASAVRMEGADALPEGLNGQRYRTAADSPQSGKRRQFMTLSWKPPAGPELAPARVL
jgi:hypothetical protein